MGTGELLVASRRAAGVSQAELARRAGTSRPTLSAYGRGHKSPSLDTAQWLLDQVGWAHVASRGSPDATGPSNVKGPDLG